jgi:hypothetical protein
MSRGSLAHSVSRDLAEGLSQQGIRGKPFE